MKRRLVAVVILVGFGFTGPARSADMPVKAPMAAFNWTGCYAGVEGGGAWGQMSAVVTTGAGGPFASGNTNGGLIGGTLGCNYQTGAWVLGLENDLSWRHFSLQSSDILPFLGLTQTSANWLDTLRGRVGYAADRWLWYVTGGAAFTNLKVFQSAPGFTAVTSEIDHNITGWTVGAGVEWALPDPRWSLKAEYLYIDYGTQHYDFFGATGGVFGGTDFRLRENIARVGLNYRLGGM